MSPVRRPAVLRLVASLVLTCLPIACAPQQVRLTPTEQAAYGTRTFNAPLANTFAAARERLPQLGYEFAYVDLNSGRIVTKRQLAGVQASIGIFGRESAAMWLQFDLQFQSLDATHTRVIATPHMLEDARDVSDQKSWYIGGEQGLRAKWRAMFENIAAGAASAGDGAAE